MAEAVLINTPISIDNADTTTNWVGDTFELEPDNKVQGTNSVSCGLTSTGNNDIHVAGSWDLTAGEHLRLWNNNTMTAYIDTMANGGIQIFISDGTNTAYWNVGGSDTYGGGWKQFVVDTASTPDSGTVPTGNTTQIGMRFNCSTRPKNVINSWFDAWTYGDGYTVTGGTSGDEIDWSHIADIDKINAYNIVSVAEDTDNIFLLSGAITIGSGATTTYFKDSGQTANFKDLNVSTSLYKIIFQGSGCHVNIDGGTYDASALQTFDFDASDVDLASFVMSGKAIVSGGSTTFKAEQTVSKCIFNVRGTFTIPNIITDSSFNACDAITLTGTLTNCTIDKSTGVASIIVADLVKVDEGVLISDGSNHAVKLTDLGSGSMVWEPNTTGYDAGVAGEPVTPTDTSNEALYIAVSSGEIDINVAQGATTPSIKSDGAIVNVIEPEATLTLTGLVDNTEVRLYSSDLTEEIFGLENSSGGTVNIPYGGTYVDAVLVIHNVNYIIIRQVIQLDGVSATLPIQQRPNTAYKNPT